MPFQGPRGQAVSGASGSSRSPSLLCPSNQSPRLWSPVCLPGSLRGLQPLYVPVREVLRLSLGTEPEAQRDEVTPEDHTGGRGG